MAPCSLFLHPCKNFALKNFEWARSNYSNFQIMTTESSNQKVQYAICKATALKYEKADLLRPTYAHPVCHRHINSSNIMICIIIKSRSGTMELNFNWCKCRAICPLRFMIGIYSFVLSILLTNCDT